MAEMQPDETTIRQYLLGQADAKSDLAESLDERMLMDRNFSALVDCIEEEIIQDYLEGDLDQVERTAMERHFLRPPERQEKLRRARLLNQHLAARGVGQEQSKPAPVIPRRSRLALWTSYAGWAAALLLIAPVGYLMNSQRALQSDLSQKTGELEIEHERAANAEAKLQNEAAALPQPVVNLNFYGQGAFREVRSREGRPSSTQQIVVAPKTLHVELLLDGISQPRCQILLQSKAGKLAWLSQAQAFPSGKHFALRFNVPVDGIAPGGYEFKVSECANQEKPFSFQVSGP